MELQIEKLVNGKEGIIHSSQMKTRHLYFLTISNVIRRNKF